MTFARGVATRVHVFAGGDDVANGTPYSPFADPQRSVTRSFLAEAQRG